jgi:transcriptional regulator of aromatic amino acid metabolism
VCQEHSKRVRFPRAWNAADEKVMTVELALDGCSVVIDSQSEWSERVQGKSNRMLNVGECYRTN